MTTESEFPDIAAPAAPVGVGGWTDHVSFAFDLETTGADPLEARIVTASIIEVLPGGTKGREWDWLLNPGVEIPEGATAVHGISTEHAVEFGGDAVDGIVAIFNVLASASAAGAPIIGHNIAYDLTVLAAEVNRAGIAVDVELLRPVIDTIVLDKAVDKFRRGKRTLIVTAAHYGVALSEEDAHGASADAYASALIALAIAAQYPEIAVDARRLHGWQVKWAATQAASLQSYFRKKDPDAFVDPAWPVRDISGAA